MDARINPLRIGRFTSSEIVALTKGGKSGAMFGSKAETYIQQTNWERRLKRSLDTETNAKALSWGKLLERYVHESILPLEYRVMGDESMLHPTVDNWSGSADCIKADEGRTVGDNKCPLTLTSFCQLADPLYDGLVGKEAIEAICENHTDGDKYFWQLVSNAEIYDCKYAELIVFMPYKSELNAIRDLANHPNFAGMEYQWIRKSDDEQLPYLLDGGFYKNLNIIRWEVERADRDYLKLIVFEASKLLIK